MATMLPESMSPVRPAECLVEQAREPVVEGSERKEHADGKHRPGRHSRRRQAAWQGGRAGGAEPRRIGEEEGEGDRDHRCQAGHQQGVCRAPRRAGQRQNPQACASHSRRARRRECETAEDGQRAGQHRKPRLQAAEPKPQVGRAALAVTRR